MPRSEFLEPFLDEAVAGLVEKAKKRYVLFKVAIAQELCKGVELNEDAFMTGLQTTTGKAPDPDLPAGDVPFSEINPDIYPCLLAMCGSGSAFYKVIYRGLTMIVNRDCFYRT